ncbi:MAG: sugar ABC transporter permease [Caldilinea sp.]|nr:sugar ABC transporter permease [Caldilinea sp.]MCB9116576.1 sugar ABC transporter permease [Caldilineaceae bacterium]MCB9118129.1 sugar ABC transporter permease [Caldilineaceae bacterium]MCO5208292.1 sugar ABC transporter permease [Caldilinea sp.]MCW5844863.1 sugar ABC transporter permease [Caldilinea sp.]
MTAKPRQSPALPPERISLSARIGNLFYSIYAGAMTVVGWLAEPVQRAIGANRMAYFFVLPNLLIFGIFVLFPMLLNIYYSFTGGNNLFPQDRPFVGMQNYQRLFNCANLLDPATCSEDRFWRGFYNTAFFVVFQVGGMVILAMLTAVVLNRSVRGRSFFRSVFFYPVLLSPVVVALIWKWILQRDGLLNAFLVSIGMERVLFFLNANWAVFWVISISIWAQMGFYMLILLAGLQSIPKDMYEAADMDGANRWQSFRGITLPLLMPTLLVVLVLSVIRAVQVFDQVWVLTGGGPGTATVYVVQYIYETAFANQTRQFGMASAASVVLGMVLLVLTLLQLRAGRESDIA